MMAGCEWPGPGRHLTAFNESLITMVDIVITAASSSSYLHATHTQTHL